MVTTCLHIRSTPNYKDYYKGHRGHRGQVPIATPIIIKVTAEVNECNLGHRDIYNKGQGQGHIWLIKGVRVHTWLPMAQSNYESLMGVRTMYLCGV